MLIVMRRNTTAAEIEGVCDKVRRMGFDPHVMPGANRTSIGVTGNPGPIDPAHFLNLPGVVQAIPVTKPYKLVQFEMRGEPSRIKIPAPGGDVVFGGEEIVVMAGPCAVEGEAMILEAARAVRAAGGQILRGGAYKPRTSPYSFQGLGEEGVAHLVTARTETGLPIVTEAVDVESLERIEAAADIIQIGARNMQNFTLLRRAGQSSCPILLKRGMSATLSELLQAAEYILYEGNHNVILCERGVRTFSDHTRNTLDLSAVPVLKRMTHLPVIVDPSHGTGNRADVGPMALAAIAAGADGLVIEVHPHPEDALSDGPQSLTPEAFAELMRTMRTVAGAVGRRIA